MMMNTFRDMNQMSMKARSKMCGPNSRRARRMAVEVNFRFGANLTARSLRVSTSTMTTAEEGTYNVEIGARSVSRVEGARTPTGGIRGYTSEKGFLLCA